VVGFNRPQNLHGLNPSAAICVCLSRRLLQRHPAAQRRLPIRQKPRRDKADWMGQTKAECVSCLQVSVASALTNSRLMNQSREHQDCHPETLTLTPLPPNPHPKQDRRRRRPVQRQRRVLHRRPRPPLQHLQPLLPQPPGRHHRVCPGQQPAGQRHLEKVKPVL
jgi:hypothetical protein